MIELNDVRKNYRMGDTVVQALRGVSLTIASGEFVAIAGPSGSGKSTLMHVIGLLDVPDTGDYRLDGQRIANLTDDQLAILRRERVGFIFQQFHLLPRTTAAENVSLPLLYSQQRTDLEAARQLLTRVGLAERVTHRPNELSGGQQQRVAIARALVNRPRMLLADEPTGNLDSATRDEIMALLKGLNREGITVILVTHEPEIARMANRRIYMRDGRIESDEHAGRSTAIAPSVSVAAPAPAQSGPRWLWNEFRAHARQGMRALGANKVRTALSVLGVLIGVATVLIALAIGRGAQQRIEQDFATLGSNLLVLEPGQLRVAGVSREAGPSTGITVEDAIAIKERVPGVKEATPIVRGGATQVVYGNRNWRTEVLGGNESLVRIRNLEPTVGRFFTEEEDRARVRVVLVGATVARELFGNDSPIGQSIKLNRINFQVIGVLPRKGGDPFYDPDNMVVVPIMTAMYRVLGRNTVDAVEIQVESREVSASVQEAVKELMLIRHRVPPTQAKGAYQIDNLTSIQAALDQSSRTMTMLLFSIAATSLLVGGIGIMNIMLVSVTERTREIGLRKAVGARRRDILIQFLMEAVIVSALGGLAGMLLGEIATVTVAFVTGWPVMVSPDSVLLAFTFSAVIGIIFGIYPARRAAALSPIEALRYE